MKTILLTALFLLTACSNNTKSFDSTVQNTEQKFQQSEEVIVQIESLLSQGKSKASWDIRVDLLDYLTDASQNLDKLQKEVSGSSERIQKVASLQTKLKDLESRSVKYLSPSDK